MRQKKLEKIIKTVILKAVDMYTIISQNKLHSHSGLRHDPVDVVLSPEEGVAGSICAKLC